VSGQLELVLLELFRREGIEEIGESFRVERALGAALIEALLDLTQVKAQAAQDVRGVEEHRADLAQAGEAEEGFVDQDLAEELRGDGVALAGIGEVLEEGEEAVLVQEGGELVEEAAGGGQEPLALAPLERRDDGCSIRADQGPGGSDFAGRHQAGSLRRSGSAWWYSTKPRQSLDAILSTIMI